ncbi:hypothetical protein [Vineibacter terrae]|uniref:hypothetical protein n=1 Tax=Vineibacter terrae TaxID=2586908 RepID=UPI0015B3D356|nr:hypothetical protein [Vineibacter terrae]
MTDDCRKRLIVNVPMARMTRPGKPARVCQSLFDQRDLRRKIHGRQVEKTR